MKLYRVNTKYLCVNERCGERVIYLDLNDVVIYISDDLYFAPKVGELVVSSRHRNIEWALEEIKQ